ncbi:MAG TPA: hypothetical protein DEP53_11450 [Bacteroidetes bacterium]|nr:MAG: hypothetical protein A2X66_08175 [Ignavibacteria bacterium GWA2_54_16]HCA80335.1 hypothetical protein [Bacteroidota bacterium]
MSDLYLFLQRTQSWYGAVELVQSYRRNLRKGLVVSVGLHGLLVLLYWWLIYTKPDDSSVREVRITTYEELEVSPGVGQSDLGLAIVPLQVRELETGDEPVPAVRPSKGFTTRKPNSQPRAMGRGIGDLPSVLPNDKVNANSLAPVEPTSQWERNDPVGGNNNRDDRNDVRGGKPVIGRDGPVPSGLASSGIGSAAKPAPGLYGTGGRGGTDFYGDGEGGGIGYSMKWLRGGTRGKVSGELPKYPAGVKVEAEIRLFAIVSPDGSVVALHPAQKADSRLEEAALKEVRYWRFERLKPSQPQVDQTCEIAFLFTLK